MKNTGLLHQPVVFRDLKRILVKRFGSEYNGITGHHLIDFAVSCEIRYLLEQLHPLLPTRLLLNLYEHKSKPASGLQRVLHLAVRRVRYYEDLLLLLNILGITFCAAYSPNVKRQYVREVLAELVEEMELLLIEQRMLEISLRKFGQINSPAIGTAPPLLLNKLSEYLQRSRFKAALYYLVDMIAHQSIG